MVELYIIYNNLLNIKNKKSYEHFIQTNINNANKEISELKTKISITKIDSIKVELLNNLGTLYYSIKKDDSSFLNFTNAYHLAKKIDNYKYNRYIIIKTF